MINWLNTKTGLKFLSLLVAVLLWLVVYLDGNSELDVTVPVQPVNIPAGLTIVKAPVRTLTLRITGPRAHLLFVDKPADSVKLDLSGAVEGETVFTNMGLLIKLPQDVLISRISPSSVNILLGKIQNR